MQSYDPRENSLQASISIIGLSRRIDYCTFGEMNHIYRVITLLLSNDTDPGQ